MCAILPRHSRLQFEGGIANLPGTPLITKLRATRQMLVISALLSTNHGWTAESDPLIVPVQNPEVLVRANGESPNSEVVDIKHTYDSTLQNNATGLKGLMIILLRQTRRWLLPLISCSTNSLHVILLYLHATRKAPASRNSSGVRMECMARPHRRVERM